MNALPPRELPKLADEYTDRLDLGQPKPREVMHGLDRCCPCPEHIEDGRDGWQLLFAVVSSVVSCLLCPAHLPGLLGAALTWLSVSHAAHWWLSMLVALPLMAISGARSVMNQRCMQFFMTLLGVLMLYAVSWYGDSLVLNVGGAALLLLAPFYDRLRRYQRSL